MKIFTFLLFGFFLFCNVLTGQNPSAFIHVDQFGYLPEAEKVAVISNPQIGYNANLDFTPGTDLEVREFSTNQVYFTAAVEAWSNGEVHDFSGDQGWWFDFSALDRIGTYYIFDPVNNHRSGAFEIKSNIYKDVLNAASKAFYYNRCNAPKESPYADANWVDEDNFKQDSVVLNVNDTDPQFALDLRGGWFDAGDYNKYVTFTHDPLHQLLTAYEMQPDIFGDDWNIPESSNGFPDILDEVKWELDWLMKMVQEDSTVLLKQGSLGHDVNSFAPPSFNHAQRYYLPGCSASALSVASSFAHAALVFDKFPAYQVFAQQLATQAEITWQTFKNAFDANDLQTDCDDGTIVAGDADWNEQTQIDYSLVAAVYLFQLTNNAVYNTFIMQNIESVEPIVHNFWSPQHAVLAQALLSYSHSNHADAATAAIINNSLRDAIINNWGNYFAFNDDDLYRVNGPDWAYYWGSNMTMANIGNLCLTLAYYNLVPGQTDELKRKAAEQLHYFHGVNPQGMVYLSNMYDYGAFRSANEIFHLWFADGTDWDHALNSTYGPAPGFLAGGPNQAYTGSLSPPANQPIQKAYLDYNNGYDDVAYEITEPAIYYQAAYIQLLSNFVDTSGLVSTHNLTTAMPNSKLYWVEDGTVLQVECEVELAHLFIFDAKGALKFQHGLDASKNTIKLDVLPGIYFYQLLDEDMHRLGSGKLIKPK